MAREMITDGQETRSLRPVAGIPIAAAVVATPPGRMSGASGAITRLGIHHDLELVLSSPGGVLVTANHVGHAVHEHDPGLVGGLVQHVLRQTGK
jgi:hypothetical protein